MTFDNWRRRADAVRGLPLDEVLRRWGAAPDPRDRTKWRTERGAMSLTGDKFHHWGEETGGGGAIDLVMHLADLDFRSAVVWLEQHLGALAAPALAASTSSSPASASSTRRLSLPAPCVGNLPRARRYLTETRRLPAVLLEPLIFSGKLYADRRGNAVFVMTAGRTNLPTGAELRGTGRVAWRSMSPGTRKDAGFFWTGATNTRVIVLCESAIDALSCHALHPDRIVISTAGARSSPRWLRCLIERGYQICCGFDTDEAGEQAAAQMIAAYPTVQRLRPAAHDWNDALLAGVS